MITPYFADDTTTLYLGDCRDVVPALTTGEGMADLVLADPPYGETALAWDRWPDGWTAAIASASSAMWCFGSLKLFGMRFAEFCDAGWRYSQDIVWEKHNGSGFHADRFKRVHEHATHWYRGLWSEARHEVPVTLDATARQVRRKQRPAHMGYIERGAYSSEDGGPRLMRSVLFARSMHGRALHPTEKPVELLVPLIEYACPPGGTVLDPFAGSGSTAEACRLTGRRAVLVEADERYAELIARRFAQGDLFSGGAA